MVKIDYVDAILDQCLEEQTISNKKFSGKQRDVILKNVTFDNCIFQDVNFDNVVFDGVDFVNVIFQQCDLSNKNFYERLIKNVEFNNCKLIGVNFIDSFIKKTKFEGVSARYINMSGAKIDNLQISNSDLSEGTTIEVHFKNVCLNSVNFIKAEFLKSNMKSVDFTSSDITDVMFDMTSVRGIVLNQFQCVELAELLGAEVKFS